MSGGIQALIIFALMVLVVTCLYVLRFVIWAMSYFDKSDVRSDDEKNGQSKKEFYKAWIIIMVISGALALFTVLVK